MYINDGPLVRQLIDTTNDLARAHVALGETYRGLRIKEAEIFASETWPSVAAADRAVKIGTVGYAVDISRLEGEIASLTAKHITLNTLVSKDVTNGSA